MPASKKDMKKAKVRSDAKAGIVAPPRKAAEVAATCTVCGQEIRVTKRNVEMVTHVNSKHAGKSTFEACFPGQTHD